jgi:hypothetical protein
MSDFFLEKLDKWSWEFSERLKFKTNILYEYGLSDFCICLFYLVLHDLSEIERLELIEIDFHMFDWKTEVFCEIVGFFLIASDEYDRLHRSDCIRFLPKSNKNPPLTEWIF